MAKRALAPGNMLYPLPVALVSCQYPGEDDPECEVPALCGKPNILTIAWAGTVCTNPPMLSVSVRPERYSYHMIRASGEFVLNLPPASLARAADFCGVRSGREVDKFKELRLTPLPSREVSPPGIAECPVSIECRVRECLPLGSHHLFIADVAAVTVDGELFDGGDALRLERARLLCYSHGAYFALGERLGTFGFSVAGKKKGRGKGQKGRGENFSKSGRKNSFAPK